MRLTRKRSPVRSRLVPHSFSYKFKVKSPPEKLKLNWTMDTKLKLNWHWWWITLRKLRKKSYAWLLHTDTLAVLYTHPWIYPNNGFRKTSDKSNSDKSRLHICSNAYQKLKFTNNSYDFVRSFININFLNTRLGYKILNPFLFIEKQVRKAVL